MNTKLFESTVKLWELAVEEEQLEDVEGDVALGAHYAKLALDGTVKLTASGIEKVEAAHETLTDLFSDED